LFRPVTLLLLLLFAALGGFAQIGLRLVQFRPTGELGMIMEKNVSAELLYIDDFEDDVRFRISLGMFKLQPRMENFPITGTIYNGQGLRVTPGVQHFEKWDMYFFSGGMDWAVVRLFDEKLRL